MITYVLDFKEIFVVMFDFNSNNALGPSNTSQGVNQFCQ